MGEGGDESPKGGRFCRFVATDAGGSWDGSGETVLLLCSEVGFFDTWSACVFFLKTSVALRGHLENGALVGLGNGDPLGG